MCAMSRYTVPPVPGLYTVGMGEIAAQGRVGRLLGMNVVVDPSMPTNQGAGANQDPVIVMPASDQILWESTVPGEAFRETKSDSLAVYPRVFTHVAFTTRYAKSISIINATGLVSPTSES